MRAVADVEDRRREAYKARFVRRALVFAVAVLLSLPATASAERAFTIGKGFKPKVAVEGDGTAHVVWTEEHGAKDRLRYCQVPRGATECKREQSFTGTGDVTRVLLGYRASVFVSASGKRVSLLASYPNGKTTGAGTVTLSYLSENGGKTFEKSEVGDMFAGGAEDAGQLGERYYLVDGEGEFTRAGMFGPLPNSSAELPRLLGKDLTTQSLATSSPEDVVVTMDEGVAGGHVFRATAPTNCEVILRCKNRDANLAPWSAIQFLRDNHSGMLAPGPDGLASMWVKTKPGRVCPCRFGFRRFTGGRFGAAYDEIAEKGAAGGSDLHDLFQDGKGRLHAVWPRTSEPNHTDLRYARSSGGTEDFSKPRSLLTGLRTDPRELEVATAPDGKGLLVFNEVRNGDLDKVKAVPVAAQAEK